MLKTHLVLGTYNHLPEGIDDTEFETVYQTCYRPFLSALNRFPDIQATLHYSGSLLRRFEAKHPEYLMLLEEMSGRRQIELLGGGFYAPLMPLIPGSDRLGQIEMLTTYLRKSFGKRPRGCWLSEYAWEPWLASTLQTSGMDYTFLSSRQFRDALGNDAEPLAPVMTEDQGRCVVVLPVVDCTTCFASPVGLVEAVESSASASLSVVMAPGESIGALWEGSGLESPDLYMERTFAWFRRNALESETTTPSRYLKSRRVTSKLYFPGSSTVRFMDASAVVGTRPACGSLRRSILRYASTASLYSKMYYVHLLIGQLRGDKSRKKTAVEDLWRGQCGNAYWKDPESATGRFRAPTGRVDDPAIREAAYRALLDAEITTRQKGVFVPGIIRADLDFDGSKEYIYQGLDFNAYIHSRGAVLVELDALKARKNLCDVFVDATEGDHARKSCFVDRLYAENPDTGTAVHPWLGDTGVFSCQYYDESAPTVDGSSVSFSREGIVGLGGMKRSLAMTKRYSFAKKAIRVSYTMQNRSDTEASLWLGVELNLSLGPEALESLVVGDVEHAAGSLSHEASLQLGEATRLALRGNGSVKSVAISSTIPTRVDAALVGGTAIQGIALLVSWPLVLPADGTWHTELTLTIHD